MREEILIHLGKKWRSELMYRLKSLITRLCSRVNGVVNNYELAKSMSPGHQGKRRWREKKERKEKNGRGKRERRKENLKWDFQTKATVWVVAHGIVALYPPRSIDETEGVASPSLQMPRKHFSTRTGSTVVSRFPDIRSLLFFLFKLNFNLSNGNWIFFIQIYISSLSSFNYIQTLWSKPFDSSSYTVAQTRLLSMMKHHGICSVHSVFQSMFFQHVPTSYWNHRNHSLLNDELSLVFNFAVVIYTECWKKKNRTSVEKICRIYFLNTLYILPHP